MSEPPDHLPGAVLALTGPTACGKSGMAVRIAEAFDGVVINADSMQVYRDLHILTARPGAPAVARAPHRLYGVLPATIACTAERWRTMAIAEIDRALAAGQLPILVGGTGLYLRALLQGLARVPDIPAAVRGSVRTRQRSRAPADFHAELAAKDPVMAARIHVTDTQRTARAMEVVEANGRSLAEYQAEPANPPIPQRVHVIAAVPPRAGLHRRIERRLETMVQRGGLDELRALIDRNLDPSLPAMNALGVRQLAGYLHGERDFDDALAAAQAATRRYAKRQYTWLRNQTVRDAASATFIGAQFSKSLTPVIFNDLRDFGLTTQRSDTSVYDAAR